MKTSDAKNTIVSQSVVVERCEYRHDWQASGEPGTDDAMRVTCSKCKAHPRNDKEEKQAEAYIYLRKILHKGSTVYTILKHVSRSGMTRGIDCYAIVGVGGLCVTGNNLGIYGKPIWITSYVGHAIDQPQPIDYWRKSLGLKIGGCGMDMGFHVVNSLSYALYGDGNSIKHEWL